MIIELVVNEAKTAVIQSPYKFYLSLDIYIYNNKIIY